MSNPDDIIVALLVHPGDTVGTMCITSPLPKSTGTVHTLKFVQLIFCLRVCVWKVSLLVISSDPLHEHMLKHKVTAVLFTCIWMGFSRNIC